MLVGIGASAGGVDALMRFFEHLPADAGLAFVVILHLAPEHESHLAEVLRTRTQMPVEQVNEPVRVERNRVYVVPPDRNLYMADGHIRLSERGQNGERPAPIDLFFRTLADSYKERAIAVVLSGAGADGSVGVRRVKEMGGVSIAQDPAEAEHGAMPRGAVETGAVDFVLPAAAIPEKLVSLRQNAERIQLPPVEQPRPGPDEDSLRELLGLLRARTRHDFTGYKRSTLLRRIERRMQVTESEDLPAYLEHVHAHPEELQGLLSDLLISVTNFFRDPEAFAQLESEVVPHLFAGKGPDEQVRVWVTGCATGEEAYTLAMLLIERAERLQRTPSVQVFASDIDEAALQRAREGVYPEAIAADVSPERLKRFFLREGQHYRVKRELREAVLFTPHNVLRDPPFSKLDLVSCRNLLIYINRQTQERVLEIFHFALKPGGYLFLGSSESAEGLPDLFAPADKKHRVFRRLDAAPSFRGAPALPVQGRWESRLVVPPQTAAPGAADAEPSSFGELHFRTLEAFAPPSVLVNAEYEIVHSSENAGRFLRFASGEPSRSLLKVAHPDLQMELRSLLLRAEQSGGATRDVPVQMDGGRKVVRISVRPVTSPRTAPGFRLVVFEELPDSPQRTQGDGARSAPRPEADETLEPVVWQLEEDLQRTREQLRATVEMYETQAEEFRAANEELQATNEELRSASEELETGKEELQSVNEELSTVNNELREKIEEVSLTSGDLQNLMAATQIGTLFIDRHLRIKRYTPKVQELFNLIPSDVGRPVADITHRLDYAGLVADAEAVLRTLHSVEREAGTRDGRSFLVRLMPYRTLEDRIDGVVVTFVDISEHRRQETALRESEEKYRTLFDSIDEGYLLCEVIFDENDQPVDILYLEANPAAARLAGRDFAGRRMREIDPNYEDYWYEIIGRVALTGESVRAEHYAELHGRWFDFYASKVGGPQSRRVASVFQDVTERKLREEQQEFLLKFSDALRAEQSADAVANRALEMLIEHLRLDRSYITTYRLEEDRADLDYQIGNDTVPPLPDHFVLSEYPEAFKTTFENTLVIEDELERQGLSEAEKRSSGKLGMRAMVAATLRKENKPLWSMVAINSRPRRWTKGEIALIEEVAERTWAAVERARAEEALRASEENFRTLANASPALIWRNDAQGENVFINRHFLDFTGKTAEEIRGAGWRELVHPDDAEAYIAGYLAAAREGREWHDQNRIRRYDGEWRWFDNYAAPLFDAGGAYVGHVGFTIDITERKQAEEALRASEEKYRTLFESMDEGFCIIEMILDDDGQPVDFCYVEANKGFERQTGRRPKPGQTMRELFPEAEEMWLDTYAEVWRTGIPQRFVDYNEGLNRWFDVFVFPTGAPKERMQLAALFTDVTDKKRAEEQLRESEGRLRKALAIETVGVIFFDEEGMFTGSNETFTRMSGYTREEMSSGALGWEDLTPPEWMGRSLEALAELEATGRISPYEKEYFRKDGSRFWGLFAGTRVSEGETVEFVIDVTSRKQAEEAVRASDERLRLVVESVTDYAIITTDVRGHITSWSGGAEKMFGYTEEESVGQHTQFIFTPEDRGRGAAEEEMQLARERGRAADERWHISKRGARFYVSGVMAPLLDGGGRLTGYAKIARDLTSRKELEEALRRAHDELEERVRERTLKLAEANVSLREEVRERAAAEGRVKQLLRQLVTVQEEERRRIARELHDTLGQQLAALQMSIEMIKSESDGRAHLGEHIERARSLFDRLNSDVDFLAWELRPAALDMLGLDAALGKFVQEWSRQFGVEADYRGPGPGAPRLAPEVETNLYRILQEALQNVHKHAGADRVSVLLEERDGEAVLIVEDNGKGYDPEEEEAAGTNKGMGVTNMRERTALLGGELEIESTPGAGATIFVRVPAGGPDGAGGGE